MCKVCGAQGRTNTEGPLTDRLLAEYKKVSTQKVDSIPLLANIAQATNSAYNDGKSFYKYCQVIRNTWIFWLSFKKNFQLFDIQPRVLKSKTIKKIC